MTKYLPRKHDLRDLRETLFLRAKLTLTPQQQTELDSRLYSCFAA